MLGTPGSPSEDRGGTLRRFGFLPAVYSVVLFYGMGSLGCPVLGKVADGDGHLPPGDVQELIQSFNSCLPDCISLQEELSECRRRVAESGYIRRKMWVFGVGRGHCVPEVDSLSECTSRRARASTEILHACSTDINPHGSLLESYQRCINDLDRESNADARRRCARVLQDFLQCAKRLSLGAV